MAKCSNMFMESWKPVATVVLTVALCWIVAIGMSVMNAPRAAFLGSFAAACVAAIAVIGNSLFRDRLEYQKSEKDRQQLHLEKALLLLSFLSRAHSHLQGMKGAWSGTTYQTGNPDSDNDLTVLAASHLRRGIHSQEFAFDEAAAAASILPPKMAIVVIQAITEMAARYTTTFSFQFSDDENFVSRSNIRGALQACETILVLLRTATDVLAEHVRKYADETE
jgi:hypothetical protein